VILNYEPSVKQNLCLMEFVGGITQKEIVYNQFQKRFTIVEDYWAVQKKIEFSLVQSCNFFGRN
jgi:hypothetical protein